MKNNINITSIINQPQNAFNEKGESIKNLSFILNNDALNQTEKDELKKHIRKLKWQRNCIKCKLNLPFMVAFKKVLDF